MKWNEKRKKYQHSVDSPKTTPIVVTLEEEKIVRWVIDNKEDWGKEEEIEEDHRKIEEMVPKRFLE